MNAALYDRVRQILASARASAARSVNSAQVVANWLVGREIVVEEQKGKGRADYGDQLMHELAEKLQREYGSGYSLTQLKLCRKFYVVYARLLPGEKGHAPRDLFVAPAVGPEQQQIFTSRYQFHLPSEAELQAELRRELKELRQPVG
jgi:hypothetical protein